ncbi:MAG TPA: hypothetical protein VK658_19160 [Chryseolinea sp.]|nr:hypothetical protein [Chryseolinea sp.]
MKIDCSIKIEGFSVDQFEIREHSYSSDQENKFTTRITPNVCSEKDNFRHAVDITVETLAYRRGKVCELTVTSKFLLEFPMPYKLSNHYSADFVVNIFSQLFLYANGQLSGVFAERTRDTLFTDFIIQSRFQDSLAILTRNVIASAVH